MEKTKTILDFFYSAQYKSFGFKLRQMNSKAQQKVYFNGPKVLVILGGILFLPLYSFYQALYSLGCFKKKVLPIIILLGI